MINLHNNTIITNKRKSYFLLTIYFLTLPNITNIIFSYDNDIFAMAEDSSRGSYARFSKEEDEQLRELVAIYENKKISGLLLQNKCPEEMQYNAIIDGITVLNIQIQKKGLLLILLKKKMNC